MGENDNLKKYQEIAQTDLRDIYNEEMAEFENDTILPDTHEVEQTADQVIEQLKDKQYAAENETALDMVVKGFALADETSLLRNQHLIENITNQPVNDHVFLAIKEKLKPELKQPHVQDFMRRLSWKEAFDKAKQRHSQETKATSEPSPPIPKSMRG